MLALELRVVLGSTLENAVVQAIELHRRLSVAVSFHWNDSHRFILVREGDTFERVMRRVEPHYDDEGYMRIRRNRLVAWNRTVHPEL